MATIRRDVVIDAGLEHAWAALREVGEPHRLFAPVLTGAELDGDLRTVRFANGMIVRERILDVDDEHRRVAYAALDATGLTFHHASMQLEIAGPGRCAFIWITDFLPAEAGAALEPLIDQGVEAFKRTIERAGDAPRASAASA